MTEQIIENIKDEKKESKQNKNQIYISSKPKK